MSESSLLELFFRKSKVCNWIIKFSSDSTKTEFYCILYRGLSVYAHTDYVLNICVKINILYILCEWLEILRFGKIVKQC